MPRKDDFDTQKISIKRRRNEEVDYGDGFDSQNGADNSPVDVDYPFEEQPDLYSYSDYNGRGKTKSNKAPIIIIIASVIAVILIVVVTIFSNPPKASQRPYQLKQPRLPLQLKLKLK